MIKYVNFNHLLIFIFVSFQENYNKELKQRISVTTCSKRSVPVEENERIGLDNPRAICL